MYQLTEAIGALVSPEDLLNRVMDLLFGHLQVDRGFILMFEDGSNDLVPKVIRFRRPPKGGQRITTSRTIINHVLQRCEGVLCTNAMTDQRFSPEGRDDSIHRYGLTSVICVPILARRRIHGVIHIDSSVSTHSYSSEQLRLATAIGHMTGMAIENAKLVQSRLQNERLAAVGETVAYLSHYIKNVLQGLRSGMDLVQLGLTRESLDTAQQGWKIAERGLDKIFHLTTNMLTFSKDREPNIVMAQLNTIVRDAVELAQRQADDKKVMLLTDFEELPPAPVDTDGVHQVALNLINNAVEACEPDVGRVVVRTHYDGEAGAVTLAVEDNGAGIPPDRLETIFQTFESTKGQGGTGLGLAAARKIVEEHQGRIEVQSKPGEGTTFRAHFPTDVQQASDETHSGPSRSHRTPQARGEAAGSPPRPEHQPSPVAPSSRR
jgi:signal transduction histidine kinase